MEDHSPQYNLSSQLRGHGDDESSASQRVSSQIPRTLNLFPGLTQGITGATTGATTGSPQVSMARSNKRWTAEEEAAFKNGINKHSVGKWSTIIKDPEFQTVLQNRSDVDLKDKWRNMQQALTGVQRRKQVRRDISKQEGKSVASTDAENDNEDEIALEVSQEDKWKNMQQASTGVQRPKHVRRDISKQEGKSVASPDAGNDNEDEIALEASQELSATPGATTGSPQVSMARSNKRWTAEEEAAFKNGINKHGVGKWSTIIKDPEFQTVLQNRSNVDLKDKWRNMQHALTGVQRRKQVRRDISKQEGKSVASTDAENDNEDEIALEASQEVNTYVRQRACVQSSAPPPPPAVNTYVRQRACVQSSAPPPPPCGACRAASRKTCPENCRFKAFFTFEESKTYTSISEYFKSGKILEILSSCRASEVEACKKNMLKTAHKYNMQPVDCITEMDETRKMQEELINKLREELAAANAICRQVAMANLPSVIPDV